jgi:hypothetical protein
MNWNEARAELADGNAVYRLCWTNDEYVDAEFNPDRIVKYTDGGISECVTYDPTEEDQRARDWALA